MIRDCRKSGPSKEVMLKYPEIGSIIGKMVNINPSLRPSAIDLKNYKIFKTKIKMDSNDWETVFINLTKCMIKIDADKKAKTRYIKILNGSLAIYIKKINKKAQVCYPLEECKIVTSNSAPVYKRNRARNQSLYNFDKDLINSNYSCKMTIEHPQLETLHIFFQPEIL